MKTRFVAAMVAMILALTCQNVFAQGGPTQAQINARSSAKTAQDLANTMHGAMVGDYNDMMDAKGRCPTIAQLPNDWTQAMVNTYQAFLTSGDNAKSAGDTYSDLGDEHMGDGDTEMGLGDYLWGLQNWAGSVPYYNESADDYELGTVNAWDSYDNADESYQEATSQYNSAYSYYLANVNMG